MKNCIGCSKEIEEYKTHCGNTECYKKYMDDKKKTWNDPWINFPIGMGGFFGMMFLWVVLTPQNLPDDIIPILAVIMMIMSFGSAFGSIVLVHNHRQKKKNLPFWGLNE